MNMIKNSIIIFFISQIWFSNNTIASSITQCIQDDGTIEFTNQGCSKSSRFNSKSIYKHSSNQSLVKKTRKKSKRKSKPFKQADFVQLQNKLLKAETQQEIEQHAQKITEKVQSHAQRGKLKNAYDMVAATYVKLSKHIKKKEWEGQEINNQTVKMRSLFEEILITQSTISTANEFNLAVESAWKKHQTNY
ncbi:MAG: hypothetical protein OQL19_01660 [Gammaproteobacteria bacterium]|nr:hypothetical protein [Gammaproteobacteria bacterium]